MGEFMAGGAVFQVVQPQDVATGYGSGRVTTAQRSIIGEIRGFLHETSDTSITAGTGNSRKQRLTFTCNNTPAYAALVARGALLQQGQECYRIVSIPNRETNPFTGFQPTITAQCERVEG